MNIVRVLNYRSHATEKEHRQVKDMEIDEEGWVTAQSVDMATLHLDIETNVWPRQVGTAKVHISKLLGGLFTIDVSKVDWE